MMAAMLNCAICDSAIFNKKNTSLIPSHSTWWCQASWILPSWIQPFWTKKNFTHSFWLILMIAAILNSIFLESANLKKKLHSFILTQLDDGSHLEFYHLGFSHFAQINFTHSFWLLLMMAAILYSAMLDWHTAILDSDTLLSSLRFTQKHSHSTLTLTQTNSIWFKLIYSHSTWWCQPSWILPSWIQPSWTKKKLHSFILTQLLMGAILNSTILGLRYLAQEKLHLFILTHLDDGSHLEFCHLGFSHCHLGFRHLVIFSQIHSKTLSLHSDSDSNLFNLPQTHSFSPNLLMVAILNFTIMNLAILDSAILVFPLKLTHTCQDWSPPFAHKKTSLIHSDPTWWW